MSDIALEQPAPRKTPWHLWIVGILSLLWNAAGAYTIMSAQAGQLPGIDPAEAAYYAAQDAWFMVVTDVALGAAILAALMLLLRNCWAVPLYWVSIAAIVVTAAYDLAMGTSRILIDQGALIATCLIWCLAIAQLLYAIDAEPRSITLAASPPSGSSRAA